MIQRTRELAAAGLTLVNISHTLEDEFGTPVSCDVLRDRIERYGIKRPGQIKAATKLGVRIVWPEEKIQYFRELVESDRSQREISRRLWKRFGVSHGDDTIRRKIREYGIIARLSQPEVGAEERVAISPAQDRDLSDLKVHTEVCRPARYASCQFPIGEPRRDGFRLCGNPVPLGRPYCDGHYRICFIPSNRDGREIPTRQCG
jgi:GcrA cell cycle regulator